MQTDDEDKPPALVNSSDSEDDEDEPPALVDLSDSEDSDSVRDERQRQLSINAHPRTHQVRTTANYIILDGMHQRNTRIPSMPSSFSFPMRSANTAVIVTVLEPVGHTHTLCDNVFRLVSLRLKYGALMAYTQSKL